MNPTPTSPNPFTIPSNPFPRVRFFTGSDGQPWFEMVMAKSDGLLEDGDVVRHEARPADTEAWPAKWADYKAQAAPKGRK